MTHRAVVVAALGATQTLAWASSYYLPAVLADPMARDLGLSRATIFGLFSAALLLSGAVVPVAGRAIDRGGGRGVLALSNLVLAAGLAMLAAAQGFAGLALGWAALGVGMALGLYESAFAVLTGLYGAEARAPITGITLIAGFASTVGWPASALLAHGLGWRGACLAWAALNLAVALPVNLLLVPRPPGPGPQAPRHPAVAPAKPPASGPASRRAMVLLAFTFTGGGFVASAMAAHLPRLLEVAGATPAAAIAAAALVGPAQVGARLVEYGLLRRLHPLIAGRIACALHPLGAGVLAILGAPGVAPFALLHGAGNGMITIARGTLPLALFGPAGYGLRSGLLGAPARVAQAAAPFVFGLLLEPLGLGVLAISAALSLAALLSLLALRAEPRAAGATP